MIKVSQQNYTKQPSWTSRILVGFLMVIILLSAFAAPISVDPLNDDGIVTHNVALAQVGTSPEDISPKMPGCGADKTEGSVIGCIASIGYYVIFVPTSWVARLAAAFLDNFLIFSIDDGAYRAQFIQSGWKVVRDVANLAFIFILIYIAFKIILDLGATNVKKMITSLIIVALLVNFSLFFSRAVVDSSNILGHIFYNSMEIKGEGGEGTFGEKSISLAIVSKINPQAIIAEQALDVFGKQEITGSGGEGVSNWWYSGCLALGVGLGFVTFGAGVSAGIACASAVTTAKVSTSFTFNHPADSLAATYLIITLLASAVNIVMIGVFFSIALLFLARVIGLFLLMILSPIAFISHIIPGLRKEKYIGWDDWLKQFFSLAFLAPIFLFFLYLIVMFIGAGMGSDAFKDNVKNLRGINYIIAVTMPFVFIIILLKYTQKISKSLAGEVGATVVKIGKKAVGAAAMVGLGAAGAVTGRLAAARLEGAAGAKLREKAATSRMARIQLRGLEAVGKGKPTEWAARKLEEEKGLGLGAPPIVKTTLKGVGMGVGEGGYIGQQERLRDSIKADAERSMLSGRQIATQDAKNKDWENQYKEDRKAAEQSAEAAGQTFNEVQFHKDYEAGNITTTKGNNSTAYVMTGEQINAKIKKDFADRLEYGRGYVEQRQKAYDEDKARGVVFNEKEWRQKQNKTKRSMSIGEEQAASSIRADIKDKLPPDMIQNKKDIEKNELNLNKTNSELARVNRTLERIADENDVKPEEVTRSMTRDYARGISVNGSDKIDYTSAFAKEKPRGDQEMKDYMDDLKKKLKDVQEGRTAALRGIKGVTNDPNVIKEEMRKVHQDRENLKDIVSEVRDSVDRKDSLITDQTSIRQKLYG